MRSSRVLLLFCVSCLAAVVFLNLSSVPAVQLKPLIPPGEKWRPRPSSTTLSLDLFADELYQADLTSFSSHANTSGQFQSVLLHRIASDSPLSTSPVDNAHWRVALFANASLSMFVQSTSVWNPPLLHDELCSAIVQINLRGVVVSNAVLVRGATGRMVLSHWTRGIASPAKALLSMLNVSVAAQCNDACAAQLLASLPRSSGLCFAAPASPFVRVASDEPPPVVAYPSDLIVLTDAKRATAPAAATADATRERAVRCGLAPSDASCAGGACVALAGTSLFPPAAADAVLPPCSRTLMKAGVGFSPSDVAAAEASALRRRQWRYALILKKFPNFNIEDLPHGANVAAIFAAGFSLNSTLRQCGASAGCPALAEIKDADDSALLSACASARTDACLFVDGAASAAPLAPLHSVVRQFESSTKLLAVASSYVALRPNIFVSLWPIAAMERSAATDAIVARAKQIAAAHHLSSLPLFLAAADVAVVSRPIEDPTDHPLPPPPSWCSLGFPSAQVLSALSDFAQGPSLAVASSSAVIATISSPTPCPSAVAATVTPLLGVVADGSRSSCAALNALEGDVLVVDLQGVKTHQSALLSFHTERSLSLAALQAVTSLDGVVFAALPSRCVRAWGNASVVHLNMHLSECDSSFASLRFIGVTFISTTSARICEIDANFGPAAALGGPAAPPEWRLMTWTQQQTDEGVLRGERNLQWAALGDLLRLPSRFRPDDTRFGVTVVLGVWRRPQYFERMVNALLNQTFPPTAIWVTCFASEHEPTFRLLVDNFRSRGERRVEFISGHTQFKYFGRFALALLAKTSHVMVFDDDSIPGRKFFEFAMHVSNIEGFSGLLGVKGHFATGPVFGTGQLVVYGPLAQIDFLQQVDLVGGGWVFPTCWGKYLFSEDFFTQETGEDFAFSYSLAKLLGVRSYVMPHTPDPDYNGFSADYYDISLAGDTTKGGLYDLRRDFGFALWQRGAHRGHSVPKGHPTVLVILSSPSELEFVARLWGRLKADGSLPCVTERVAVVSIDPQGLVGTEEHAVTSVPVGDVREHFVDCFAAQRADNFANRLFVWQRRAEDCTRTLAAAWRPALALILWGGGSERRQIGMHAVMGLWGEGVGVVGVGELDQAHAREWAVVEAMLSGREAADVNRMTLLSKYVAAKGGGGGEFCAP